MNEKPSPENSPQTTGIDDQLRLGGACILRLYGANKIFFLWSFIDAWMVSSCQTAAAPWDCDLMGCHCGRLQANS